MSIFKKKLSGSLVPINADNAKTRDWLVLLEAATIVGRQRGKLRVALTTQERRLVKKRRLFRKTQHFLVVDGYDPRIHALYFCPQLYKNEDEALIPLSGEEIGQLNPQALEAGAIERRPWYDPSESVTEEPVIRHTAEMEFDSLVVDPPPGPKTPALHAVPSSDKEKGKT